MTQRMRTTLDLPTAIPEWATNAGRKIEPGQTDKELGWVVGTRPPARWDNWLLDAVMSFAKTSAGTIVGTWNSHNPTDAVADNIKATHYHPELGLWVGSNWNDTEFYYCEDGYNWRASGETNSNSNLYASGKDTSRLIISGTGATTGSLQYTTDGINYNSQPTLTGCTVYGVETKYPDSDYCVWVGIDGYGTDVKLGFAANVTTASTYPTTFPTIANGDLSIDPLRWLTGQTWILLTEDGHSYRTINDCVDWAATTEEPQDVASASHTKFHGPAYNQDSGRLVVVAYDDTSAYTTQPEVLYSDDNGTSWDVIAAADAILSDAPMASTPDSWGCSCVYYCGGGMWIIGGNRQDRSENDIAWLSASLDNGLTWVPVGVNDSAGVSDQIGYPSCDGRHLVLSSTSSVTSHTLLHSNALAATVRQ